MSLVDKARAALRGASAPFVVEVEEAAQRLHCDMAAIDSLAYGFTGLVLSSDRLADATPDNLKRIGETLAGRLTYLLEPIRAIEFDDEHCVLQMRSNPPERDADRTSYYELVVRRGGEISLCRYAKLPGDARQVIPANVTHEVFWRLAGDLSAAVP